MLLQYIVGSEARIKILRYLSTKKEAYQRDIEIQLELRVSAVQSQLKGLEKEGAVWSRKGDYRVYYGLNTKYPLYKEIKALFRKAESLGKSPRNNSKSGRG